MRLMQADVGRATGSRPSAGAVQESVVEAPQEPHPHLCAPAPVFPFLFIFAPQEGQLTACV